MESKESSSATVPPGFRFHPTDEELVGYYLRKKIASQKIDLDVIRDIDLYRIEPWDLRERCRIGYEEQSEWYFFSHKDKKYPTGTRTNRATMAGFWKATGRDKAVFEKSRLIGMRKTLVFYRGRAPNGQKTEWIMHEYRLESDVNGSPQEEGWVVCRAFQKRTNVQSSKNMETWATSNYFLDEIASSSMADPQNNNGFFTTQSFPICKQEIPLQFSDPFAQLPNLESPNSLPPSTSSSQNINSNSKKNVNAVTDWRTLDKFVASQLMSHQDVGGEEDENAVSEIGASSLLCGGEEENKFVSGFLNQSSDCDFGICLFDK